MVAVFGAGVWQVILAIAISDIPRAIRLQRSLVLSLKSRPYIDAARMAHAPTWWLLARHVIPNTLAPMLVVGSIYAANAILVEASLSFLGLGITPPSPSWGNIIREGQQYLERAWWVSTFPGIAILIVSIGLHLTADGIRERLDPSLRG
jgi:peptide/nickel transport system permease protein